LEEILQDVLKEKVIKQFLKTLISEAEKRKLPFKLYFRNDYECNNLYTTNKHIKTVKEFRPASYGMSYTATVDKGCGVPYLELKALRRLVNNEDNTFFCVELFGYDEKSNLFDIRKIGIPKGKEKRVKEFLIEHDAINDFEIWLDFDNVEYKAEKYMITIERIMQVMNRLYDLLDGYLPKEMKGVLL